MSKHKSIFGSLLYVPGSNPRAIAKSPSLPVRGIIFDLEDSVAGGELDQARKAISGALASGEYGTRMLAVRINHAASREGRDDLAALLGTANGPGPNAILLPKVKGAGEVIEAAEMIASIAEQAGRPHPPALWLMIERAAALLEIGDICRLAGGSFPGLEVLVLGTNDLALETGAAPHLMTPWIMKCLLAARANGLALIGGVHNDFRDIESFEKECRAEAEMGLDGKSLIHPAQIEPCNRIFAPSPEEIERAQAIVSLFDQPENRNRNVAVLDGRMIERLHYEMALDSLQRARHFEEIEE